MAAIAKLWRRISGIAKRAIKVARELCAVTHHRHKIETILVQRRADASNSTIHHVARADAIGARRSKRYGRFRQLVQRLFQLNSVLIKHGAVAVRRVRAEAGIDPEAQAFAKLLANLGNSFMCSLMIKPALFLFRRNWK